MSDEPKEVVDLRAELGVGGDSEVSASPTPAEPRKKVPTWKFIKNEFAAQPVPVGDGKKISFRLIKGLNGGFLSHSLFETADEKLATALIEHAKAKKYYVAFLGKKYL